MKRFFPYLMGLTLATGLASCEFDNYDEPKSKLEGRIVYKGEPINVEYNNVTFELWEPGWQKRIPITVTVDQDGSYSALLFNANYRLIIPAAQGPFRSLKNAETSSDTVMVNLNGSQQRDIEVEPYYMVRNPTFTVNARKLTATCKLEQIITGASGKTIERVSLYVSKTQFVDARTSLSTTDLVGSAIKDLNAVSLVLDAPTITGQNYGFARIGVKIAGVEDMIFSPVQKVQF
ncbi:uncharacterized protein DUF3823 [Larkinella arboricola]|uniref:Uncharacterized protein DUF3823 n=1 Tax=Larkinella arboricola TaxID=643671 RepID=A0A327X6L7_LARAB|nr:DUF3823 domain-containing protein [Larkinella arboricola]RAK02309.1 uncharacterized protein DUF3823 [Larkinella arboricola]